MANLQISFSWKGALAFASNERRTGTVMGPRITVDQPFEIAKATRKTIRKRPPLPPLEPRDRMPANETALVLGSSVARVHRPRGALVPGVEPLPCSQYGR